MKTIDILERICVCVCMCVYIVARNHLTRSLPRGRASRDPVLLSALSLAIRYHNERRAPLHFFTVILCCNLSLSLSLSLSLRLFSASKRPRPEYAAYIYRLPAAVTFSVLRYLRGSLVRLYTHTVPPPIDSTSTTAVTTTVIPLSRSLDGERGYFVSQRERLTVTAHC